MSLPSATPLHATTPNSGQIGSGTFSSGNAGNLTVQANQVSLAGANTQLFASTNAGSTGNAGNIQLTVGELQLRDGAQVTTSTSGRGNAGNLTVRSRGTVSIIGTAGNGQIPSGLLSQVRPGATGQGGDLRVESDRLNIRGGGQISTATFSAGNAGDLTLRVNQIDLSGTVFAPTATNPFPSPGGISTSVFSPQATGNGGNLRINSDRLTIRNYAQIASFTLGQGNAGDVTIRSDRFDIIGQDVANTNNNANVLNTGVIALGSPGSSGNSGNVSVVSDRFSIRDGGQIAATTAGTGNGGDITIRANRFDLIGGNRTTSFTGLFTTALGAANNGTFTGNVNTTLNGGNGGNIAIIGDRLRVLNGATIATGTFTLGDSGDLTIRANQVEVSGSSRAGFISTLATTVSSPAARGDGGDLRLDTNRLLLQDGGQINASTIGRGNAGSVRINADTIDLSGVSANRPRVDRNRAGNASLALNSSITAAATSTNDTPTGSAGSVTINASTLRLSDRTTISVSNTTGSGNTGNLTINANTVRLSDRTSLQAEVSAGSQGNLRVNSDLIAIDRQSRISTNAQGTATGGNIALRTQYLVANQNSDITANAVNSFGGRVTVSAQGILGTEFRRQITPESDITASSERGAEFSGSVQLQTPNVQPGQGLTQLPETIIDPNAQVASACAATSGNQFVITGRGGVPQNPEQILERDRTWTDLRDLSTYHTATGADTGRSIATSQSMIQEATAWTVNSTGQVQLVADRSQAPSFPVKQCAAHDDN